MTLKIIKTHVWAAEINDQPGGLATALETLAKTGANLECLIARRRPDKPGRGVVFVTPLRGKRVTGAAKTAGFHETQRVATLRIEGADCPGLGARVARTIAQAGISLRGASAAVLGRKFVCYLGFDSDADASKAATALKALVRRK